MEENTDKKNLDEKNKESKYKTFQDEMFSSGAKNNIITASIILVYVLFFVEISFKDIGLVLVFATISVLIFQFFVAPFTNASYTRNISNQLISWKEGSLDIKKRTYLYIELLRCPRIIMYFVLFLFGCASLLFILLTYFFIGMSTAKLIFLFTICIFASYVAGIVALYTSEIVCNKYAIPVFDSEIDLEILKQKKYYGASLKTLFVLFTIIPVGFIAIVTFVYFLMQENILLQFNFFQIGKTIIFFLVNSFILIGLFLIFRNNSIIEIGKVQYLLEWLSVTDFKFERKIPVSLNNETSYISFLIKNTINRFPPIIDFYKTISTELAERTFLLSQYESDQNAVTENNFRIVNEINNEMKSLEEISRSFFNEMDTYFGTHIYVIKSIDEVLDLIHQSKNDISNCIKESIDATRELKNLESQLKSISEVTFLLTDIADQIKIIAFNAELEAIKADTGDNNFLIIATEIRRLADNTMDSINETRDQIELVQGTASKLVNNIHRSIDATKENKNILTKKEMLLDTIKLKIESEVVDATGVDSNQSKQKHSHDKIQALLEQLNYVLNDYNMHSYDIKNSIEHFERIADTIRKGEV